MIFYNFSFYLFASVAIISGIMVISSKNPVHSVLFLILSFINTSALFILLGAEFLAMILIVVYVGAVAVLFLFVVMMLDINFIRLREGFLQYRPIAILIGAVLIMELIVIFISMKISIPNNLNSYSQFPLFKDTDNTEIIGNHLYTEYFFMFQISGLILLVAMIGSILLTLRHRDGVKKQIIKDQISQSSENRIEKKNVKIGEGVE